MDDFDTVPVLRMHLEELAQTLAFVEGLLSAQDLQKDYVAMTATMSRPSRLTTNVRKAQERVHGYLQEESDELSQG